MPHEVKVGDFEGPVDLLLNLIARKRVDIYDVSLASITDDYMAVLEDMPAFDLETATGFLVVAAALLELKSARLLPGDESAATDPWLLEQRDLLLARLVECATYREAGAFIASGLRRGRDWHGREVGIEEPYVRLVPDPLGSTTPADVARAAATALAPRLPRPLDTSYFAPPHMSVQDAVSTIATALEMRPRATLEQLCGDVGDRPRVVVMFLALLEMFKAGAIELRQAGRFGAITATWTGKIELAEVLEDIEEYKAQGEQQ